jgi:hypothetical protein
MKFNEFDTGAKKHTERKLRVDLVPTEIIKSFAEVSQVGIDKGYEERNWEKGLPFSVHLAAAQRHIIEHLDGDTFNIEKLPDGTVVGKSRHLEHALWHLGAVVTHARKGRTELDDRESYQALKNTAIALDARERAASGLNLDGSPRPIDYKGKR